MKSILIALAIISIAGCTEPQGEIVRDGNIFCVKVQKTKLFHEGRFFVKGEEFRCIDALQGANNDSTLLQGYWVPATMPEALK